MSIKNIKKSSGKTLHEKKSRRILKNIPYSEYKIIRKLKPREIIKIDGIPWEYLNKGYIGRYTDESEDNLTIPETFRKLVEIIGDDKCDYCGKIHSELTGCPMAPIGG